MFKETYERKLNGNSLILTELGESEDTEFEDRMITENNIRGFLPCNVMYEDGKKKYKYSITSRQCLSQLFEEREMNNADLRRIIKGIINLRYVLEEYLLDDDHIILNPQFLYLDPESKVPNFVFYPHYEGTLKESLLQLGLYLLERCDHTDDAAVGIAYGFYKQLVNEDYYFEKLLKSEETEIAINQESDNKKNENERNDIEEDEITFESEITGEKGGLAEKIVLAVSSAVLLMLISFLIAARQLHMLENFNIKEKNFLSVIGILGALAVTFPVGMIINRIRKENRLLKFKEIEEDVLDNSRKMQSSDKKQNRSYGKTEELLQTDGPLRRLVNYDNGVTELKIIKDPFILGKSSSEADGVLKNQSASRIHAKISREKGHYYITDLNSTNGTKVNGRILAANERVKIEENDEISFADAVFYFR